MHDMTKDCTYSNHQAVETKTLFFSPCNIMCFVFSMHSLFTFNSTLEINDLAPIAPVCVCVDEGGYAVLQ